MKDKQLGNAGDPVLVPYLLRLPAVLRTSGLGRSTLYRLIAEEALPPPVKLAERAVSLAARRGATVGRRKGARGSPADSKA